MGPPTLPAPSCGWTRSSWLRELAGPNPGTPKGAWTRMMTKLSARIPPRLVITFTLLTDVLLSLISLKLLHQLQQCYQYTINVCNTIHSNVALLFVLDL